MKATDCQGAESGPRNGSGEPDVPTKTILIVIIALLIGALIGWLFCRWQQRRREIAVAAEWRDQVESVKRSEKRINAERKNLMAELAEVRTELSRRDDSAPADSDDIHARLKQSLQKRDSLNEALQNLIARTRDLTQTAKEKDEKIFALSRELESWQQRLPPLLNRYKDKDLQNTVILEQLEAERSRSSQLEQTLQTRIMPLSSPATSVLTPAPAARNTSADGDRTRDDLKQIRGVGPVLERTLNELGIYRFSQIANLDDQEIERIAEALPQFPGRIARDRWIEQARHLAN